MIFVIKKQCKLADVENEDKHQFQFTNKVTSISEKKKGWSPSPQKLRCEYIYVQYINQIPLYLYNIIYYFVYSMFKHNNMYTVYINLKIVVNFTT